MKFMDGGQRAYCTSYSVGDDNTVVSGIWEEEESIIANVATAAKG